MGRARALVRAAWLAVATCIATTACERERSDSTALATSRRSADGLTRPATFRNNESARDVTMRFAWPDGAHGRVETTRTVQREGARAVRAQASYRISVHREGERVSVRTRELTLTIPDASPTERMMSLLVATTFLPSSRFARDPSSLAPIEAAETAERMRTAIEAVTTPDMRATPRWLDLEAALRADDEALHRQAASILAPLLELDGLEVETGRASQVRSQRRGSEGTAGDQSTRTRLLGVGPCFEGDDEERCASVEVRAEYQAARAAESAPPESGRIESIDGRLRMLVETNTLLPHRMHAVKTTRFVPPRAADDRTSGGGATQPEPLTETETLEWMFFWTLNSIGR